MAPEEPDDHKPQQNKTNSNDKPSTSQSQSPPPPEKKKVHYRDLPQDRKLFVGGLPHGITLQELNEYFGQFGNITDSVIIQHKVTKTPRGFGFVSFDSDEAVEAVLQSQFHVLKGKEVEVLKAVLAVPPKNTDTNNKKHNDPNEASTSTNHAYRSTMAHNHDLPPPMTCHYNYPHHGLYQEPQYYYDATLWYPDYYYYDPDLQMYVYCSAGGQYYNNNYYYQDNCNLGYYYYCYPGLEYYYYDGLDNNINNNNNNLDNPEESASAPMGISCDEEVCDDDDDDDADADADTHYGL